MITGGGVGVAVGVEVGVGVGVGAGVSVGVGVGGVVGVGMGEAGDPAPPIIEELEPGTAHTRRARVPKTADIHRYDT